MKDIDNRVVITGAGLVSSLGLNASDTWDALLSGKCGIRNIEDFDARGFNCRSAARVHGLNPEELKIHPRDARIMYRHSYMLMKCSSDSFKHAELDKASIPSEDIGFFAGIGMVDYKIEDLLPAVLKSLDKQGDIDYDIFFSGGYQEIHPLWPLSMLNNISFCQVAIALGIRGENTVFSPHPDSGIHAITEAANAILERKVTAAIAGGVSETVSPLSLARASLFEILNTSDGTCRPFGSNRKGAILGEGCGVIALENRSSAVQRQVPYLAVIKGYGFSFEKSKEFNCPASNAISRAMNKALSKAGLTPLDIDVIIAHGDGTYAGDRNEIEAINHVFSECAEKVKVFSSKGALGNLLAGAPAADVILAIYMLKNGIIPATCNSLPFEENIMFNLISGEPYKAQLRRIMINAQSYEGQCASLIIEAPE